MRELALIGFICLLFGLGGYRALGELGLFGGANLALGAISLAIAIGLALRRWRGARAMAAGALLEPSLMLVALLWGAVLVERFATLSELRADWTFEGRYELASATREALASCPDSLRVTLYHDEFDPRIRRTRLLLEELARASEVEVDQRVLADTPEEEDRFGISSSNTVVFELGPRWERVDRPTEGALFEALAYLCHTDQRILYVSGGAGEGDPESTEPLGFSGLGAALETEGYRLRRLATPAISEIPHDADALLLIAPERRFRPEALAALRRYLERGGALIALLEPGHRSGLDEVLAEYGMTSPDAVVVDPSSGSVDGGPAGLSPVAFNYADHPVTAGLNRNRRTYFRGACSFALRKPRTGDDLRAIVFASGDSWLHPDPDAASRRIPPARPDDVRTDYHPLVATGRYSRAEGETRIVAFCDSDFATNRDLRALYNLDLMMNAVHWSTRRESKISLRPKSTELIQFPVPIQNSLRSFYGVGLLVPQLLLLAGGLIWLRRRSA